MTILTNEENMMKKTMMTTMASPQTIDHRKQVMPTLSSSTKMGWDKPWFLTPKFQILTPNCFKMEPSLQHLILCLEQSLGRKPHTPRDFDAFSEIISNATGETISASTLKRLWGYRKTEGRPFTSTLDILARFLLYRDFSNFLASEASIGGGVETQNRNISSPHPASLALTSVSANYYK